MILKTTFHLKNTDVTKKNKCITRVSTTDRVLFAFTAKRWWRGGWGGGRGGKQLQYLLGFPTSHLYILHFPVHVTT